MSKAAPYMVGTFILALAWATTARADLQLVERSFETNGATTVDFDSSFEDLSYTVGQQIELVISWEVDVGGTATFNDLDPLDFTPRGPDPAEGELQSFRLLFPADDRSGGQLLVQFHFSELHCDRDREVQIGNAHLRLRLNIDMDGDGLLDTVATYGVQVHVEDPGECDGGRGVPPEWAGRNP